MDFENNTPIDGAIVSVRMLPQKRIIAFMQTSKQGLYHLACTILDGVQYDIRVSSIGYETLSIPIKPDIFTYDIRLLSKPIELQEVRIKPRSIYDKGDTVVYSMSHFREKQDRSLADVLKRMPGFEVNKSGSIKYNGKPINKFYIEGKDMLGERYGIASQSIRHEDVANVEVMENHQPIKALEDISFSQNPAINIRLKERAKSRLLGVVRIGGGFKPLLFDGEISLMRFGKKTQTLNTYKGNNIGKDITQEADIQEIKGLISTYGNRYRLRDYIQVKPALLIDLNDERVTFNRSHAITTNNLLSLSKSSTLTAQFTYLNNHLYSDKINSIEYYLSDSTIMNSFTEEVIRNERKLTGDIAYEVNKSDFYLRNKFLAEITSQYTDMEYTGHYANEQQVSLPWQRYADDFHLIKKKGKKAYTLRSFNQWEQKRQTLDILHFGREETQSICTQALYSHTNTAFSYILNPFVISMRTGIVGMIRQMETDWNVFSRNRVIMRHFYPYLSPEIEMRHGKWEIKGLLPFSWSWYGYKDKISDLQKRHQSINFSPYLSLRYIFSTQLNSLISVGYTQDTPDEQSFFPHAILNNHRNISLGTTDFNVGNHWNISWGLTYRNVLQAIFMNAGISYIYNYLPRVSNKTFQRDYIINNYLPHPANTRTVMLNGNFSKGIDGIRGYLLLHTEWMNFNGILYQNGSLYDYTSQLLSITPKFSSRPIQWCSLSYEFNYLRNATIFSTLTSRQTFNRFTQKMSCSIAPANNWHIRMTAEHYCNEYQVNKYKHFFLSDAEFTYGFNNGIELNLVMRNIFDTQTYDYVLLDNLSRSQTFYHIRPRNVLVSIYFKL